MIPQIIPVDSRGGISSQRSDGQDSSGPSPTRPVAPESPLGAASLSSLGEASSIVTANGEIRSQQLATATTLESGESWTTVSEPSDSSAIVRMAPVLVPEPVREFEGHTEDVLDLAWSRGDMLLSASVDG